MPLPVHTNPGNSNVALAQKNSTFHKALKLSGHGIVHGSNTNSNANSPLPPNSTPNQNGGNAGGGQGGNSSSKKPILIRPSPTSRSAAKIQLERQDSRSSYDSFAQYQRDSQAIYNSYKSHILEHSNSSHSGHQFAEMYPDQLQQLVMAAAQQQQYQNGLDTSEPFAILSPNAKRELSANNDETDADIKAHRRLRALSAPRSNSPTSSGRGNTSPTNAVWVGMKEYKAATHKLELNRAFRVKLPSIPPSAANNTISNNNTTGGQK
jgi:hypothetical protein